MHVALAVKRSCPFNIQLVIWVECNGDELNLKVRGTLGGGRAFEATKTNAKAVEAQKSS